MQAQKEKLDKISVEIANIVDEYEEKINNPDKFNYRQRYMANLVFEYRKIAARYKHLNKKYNEEEVYKEFAKLIGEDKKRLKTYEIAERLSKAVIEGEGVIDLVGECADKIKEVYKEYNDVLYHISTTDGMKEIKASKNKLNKYEIENLDAIFATSDTYQLENSIMEANAGGLISKNGILIYPNSPFDKIEDAKDDLELNESTHIYMLREKNFEPVVSFSTDSSYVGYIHFDGEWISREEQEKVERKVDINKLSNNIFNNRQIFIQKSNIELLRKISSIKDREEAMEILEMLIEEGELEYINSRIGINYDDRLKAAQDKSDNRYKKANKTLKKIDADKTGHILDRNLEYAEGYEDEYRSIEIEAEEYDEDTAEKSNIDNKIILKNIFSLSNYLGIRATTILTKEKKKLEGKSEEEKIEYIINKVYGKRENSKKIDLIKRVILGYIAEKEKSDAIGKKMIGEVKEDNSSLLDMMYFKENGITEESIYSFIIDRCEDDYDEFDKRIATMQEAIKNKKVKSIEENVNNFLIARKLIKELIMDPKQAKKKFKELLAGKGNDLSVKSNNLNKSKIKQNRSKNKSLNKNKENCKKTEIKIGKEKSSGRDI